MRRGRGRKETLILSIGPLRPRCRIRQLRSVFATSARIPTNSPHPTRVPSPQYAGTKPHRHHQPSLQLSLAVLPLLPRHRWRYFSPSAGCTSPDRPEIPGTLPARPAPWQRLSISLTTSLVTHSCILALPPSFSTPSLPLTSAPPSPSTQRYP